MAIPFSVQAQIVDIRRDSPKPGDKFLVDTNAWYWYAYNRSLLSSQPPRAYQIKEYPAYLAKVISVSAKLYWCGLSLTEIASLVERNEYNLFTGGQLTLTLKEYRHSHPRQRRNMLRQLRFVADTIRSIGSPIDIMVNASVVDTMLTKLVTQQVDAYDLLLLEAARQAGITQVITDDGDFATVAGIQVFTGNQNMLATARTQGKLLQR